MKHVLYISVVSNQVGGGMSGLNRNMELLKKVPYIDLYVHKVKIQTKVSGLYSALTGGNLTLSYKEEKKIIELIKQRRFDYVFQESTTCGHLAESIAKTGTRLIVFGHNVETILYQERANSYKYNIFEWIKYYSVKNNEAKTIRNTNILIALTDRDSLNFKNLFARSADLIIPVSSPSTTLNNAVTKEKFGLFVGSNFFPNNEGIAWFLKNVVPYINADIKIVGSCCSSIKTVPDSIKAKVKIMGLVDDLNSLYEQAAFVIVPIFKGSGMKTKTIEAMSFGKTIFGTDECFQGIECDFNKIGGLCNTAKEFIEKINGFNGGVVNEYTLNLFERNYSNNAVQEKFNQIFR